MRVATRRAISPGRLPAVRPGHRSILAPLHYGAARPIWRIGSVELSFRKGQKPFAFRLAFRATGGDPGFACACERPRPRRGRAVFPAPRKSRPATGRTGTGISPERNAASAVRASSARQGRGSPSSAATASADRLESELGHEAADLHGIETFRRVRAERGKPWH